MDRYQNILKMRGTMDIKNEVSSSWFYEDGSVNCSTCFGWYLHPSSGAHTTVSTCQTVRSGTIKYADKNN